MLLAQPMPFHPETVAATETAMALVDGHMDHAARGACVRALSRLLQVAYAAMR